MRRTARKGWKTMTHKEQLLRLYNRTYRNCEFYKTAEPSGMFPNPKACLLNEIGTLRGIAYCIEAIVGEDNLFCEIDFDLFKGLMDLQNVLRNSLEANSTGRV